MCIRVRVCLCLKVLACVVANEEYAMCIYCVSVNVYVLVGGCVYSSLTVHTQAGEDWRVNERGLRARVGHAVRTGLCRWRECVRWDLLGSM